jgi:6-pyruvoyltetrahydropterin/6-carboxytetrahydropterin synthase
MVVRSLKNGQCPWLKKDKNMTGIFEVYIETHFSAAHALRGYPGDCARLHGHNWIIQVYVRCRELDAIGIGIDFRVIKENVRDVLQGLDHFNINELPAFQTVNPTSENIAQYLYRELGKRINSNLVSVSKVKVSETPNAGALYWEE